MMTSTRYILIACASLVLASCAKEMNVQVDGVQSETAGPIVFGPSVVPVKSMVESDDDLRTQDMSLYGWTFLDRTNPELPFFVMNGLKMWYSGDIWDYSPHQFWVTGTPHYGFAAIWPYFISRNDRDFLPTPLTETTTPFDDAFVSDDVVRNVICLVIPGNAYLTNILNEIMVGYTDVPSADYGKTVEIPMEHALSAFRFRVRNLTNYPICLSNWNLTGLKTHADMVADIIGGLDDGTHIQLLHRIEDARFVDIKHAPVEVVGSRDSIKIHPILPDGTVSPDVSDWIECVNPNPGDNNYKYIVISQKLSEKSNDGSDIEAVKNVYRTKYPNYSNQIYWGEDRNMHVNNYYIPLAYERDAVIMDFDGDGVRGDKGDYDLNVKVYECRSHMVRCNNSGVPSETGTRYYPNGGIYMPVSSTNEANLYSPYFMSSENHTTPIEDWKESMGPITDRDPSHMNDDGTYSVFRWEALNGVSERWDATDLVTAIANYTADNEVYPLSVAGGDLADALNKDGFVTMFPQDISNLKFNFMTASKVINTYGVEQDYYSAPVSRTVTLADFTKNHEWLPGYKYDYLITVTTDKILVTLDVEPWKERNAILE